MNRQISIINEQVNNIDQRVLKLSLRAYVRAQKLGLNNKQLLTIIDYSKPSTYKRLWVFDLKRNRLVMNTWVTHGKNSGGNHASSFSNQHGSLKSSIGVFVTTGSPYMGSNGYSLRLRGLEPGVNDNAYSRAVVIHGAWYAGEKVIRQYGQLGRSWGCPAVSDELAKPLINTIKDQTLVFVYYPDRNWLNRSSFLAA